MSISSSNRRSKKAYVPTSALAKNVDFDDEMMRVTLTDGRILSAPLIWYPTLHEAAPEQRENFVITAGGRGIHWPDLDEDLSVAGMMAGADRQAA